MRAPTSVRVFGTVIVVPASALARLPAGLPDASRLESTQLDAAVVWVQPVGIVSVTLAAVPSVLILMNPPVACVPAVTVVTEGFEARLVWVKLKVPTPPVVVLATRIWPTMGTQKSISDNPMNCCVGLLPLLSAPLS